MASDAGKWITAIFVIFILLVILSQFCSPLRHPFNNPSGWSRWDRWTGCSQYIYTTAIGYVNYAGICYSNWCGGQQCHFDDYATMLHVRDDRLAANDAIIEATRNRIRPIFMSTLTSLFGLVPLVIFPELGLNYIEASVWLFLAVLACRCWLP